MRLIDAESLVIAMSKRVSANCSPMYHRCYEDMLAAVGESKTIDAKLVVHGEWILKHIGAGHYWECSVCHKNPCIYVTDDTNFCPNCGADMRGANNAE